MNSAIYVAFRSFVIIIEEISETINLESLPTLREIFQRKITKQEIVNSGIWIVPD